MTLRRTLKKLLGKNQHFEMDSVNAARGLSLGTLPVATYAIGDIHGCAKLYKTLETQIIEDAKNFDGPKLLVILGDVIDRGPQSAEMIDILLSPAPNGFQRIVLRGNHEIMMQSFLDDPVSNRSWLDHGGFETLQSYGVPAHATKGYDIPVKSLQTLLTTYIPDEHLTFLDGLVDYVSLPGLTFVHADVDPSRPLEDQTRQTLCWKRPDASEPTPIFGGLVVHGHTPVDTAQIDGWHVPLDTGAYYSGVLTAARFIDGADIRFFGT